jgi:hypothetical protein
MKVLFDQYRGKITPPISVLMPPTAVLLVKSERHTINTSWY